MCVFSSLLFAAFFRFWCLSENAETWGRRLSEEKMKEWKFNAVIYALSGHHVQKPLTSSPSHFQITFAGGIRHDDASCDP